MGLFRDEAKSFAMRPLRVSCGERVLPKGKGERGGEGQKKDLTFDLQVLPGS